MNKIKCIDTHVHFRDGEKERYKETIRGGSKKAVEQGIIAVADMPNTTPPILYEKDVQRRLELAKKEGVLIKYFLWIGIIPKKDQIEEAVRIVGEIPEVIGIKLYAGPTTGNLAVTDEREQKMIYQISSDLNYPGVLAAHCERQSELKPKLWNPEKPWTHGLARPPSAEIKATEDQIRFARETDFPGKLHICHISLPETLEIVREARENDLDISGEVTPHHLLLNEDKMREKNGLLWKVNPPLRKTAEVEELKRKVIHLIQEGADWLWVATDYAPHTLEEKLKPSYPSGIANYSLYRQLLRKLNREGLLWSKIEQLTFHNPVKRFREKFKRLVK